MPATLQQLSELRTRISYCDRVKQEVSRANDPLYGRAVGDIQKLINDALKDKTGLERPQSLADITNTFVKNQKPVHAILICREVYWELRVNYDNDILDTAKNHEELIVNGLIDAGLLSERPAEPSP